MDKVSISEYHRLLPVLKSSTPGQRQLLPAESVSFIVQLRSAHPAARGHRARSAASAATCREQRELQPRHHPRGDTRDQGHRHRHRTGAPVSPCHRHRTWVPVSPCHALQTWALVSHCHRHQTWAPVSPWHGHRTQVLMAPYYRQETDFLFIKGMDLQRGLVRNKLSPNNYPRILQMLEYTVSHQNNPLKTKG